MDFTSAFDSTPTNGNGTNKTSGLAGFDAAKPADPFEPVPAGIYNARIVSGMLTTTKRGDECYRLTFEIIEGEYHKRRLFRTYSFSERAIQYAKRDLALFGLTTSRQLLEPFPKIGTEIFVKLTVALQRSDDGSALNDIKKIEILRREDSPIAGFLIEPPKPGETR